MINEHFSALIHHGENKTLHLSFLFEVDLNVVRAELTVNEIMATIRGIIKMSLKHSYCESIVLPLLLVFLSDKNGEGIFTSLV